MYLHLPKKRSYVRPESIHDSQSDVQSIQSTTIQATTEKQDPYGYGAGTSASGLRPPKIPGSLNLRNSLSGAGVNKTLHLSSSPEGGGGRQPCQSCGREFSSKMLEIH